MTAPEDWARRWQARLDAAPTPRDRASVAWSMLLATLAKAPLNADTQAALHAEVADHLFAAASAAWSVSADQSSAPRPRQHWDPTHPDFVQAP